jgi:hypothetical protein
MVCGSADIVWTVRSRIRFELLFRDHAGAVRAYAARRSSLDDADDVVAEVFLIAWRRIDDLPDDPLPWLLGVARRVLANRRRGEVRRAAVKANLTGADLTLANLANADFSKSNITRAVLSQATIFATNLARATLFGLASGVGTFGTPAELPASWRVLSGLLIGPGANLSTSNLNGINLNGMNLTGADFTGANLSNTLLTNATLVNVTLTNAVITNATFSTDNDNKLAGIVSGGLVGTPGALPASGRFRIVQGYLVGPSANLSGSNLPAPIWPS